MKLLVVRHAIAMERDDYQAQAKPPGTANDDTRPLTIPGMRKMHKNAAGLKDQVKRPTRLITSPLTRAMQTAEILQSYWKNLDPVTCEHLRPGSDPQDFSSWLNRTLKGDTDSESLIVVVGHEPHLSQVITWFLYGDQEPRLELKKGGACLLEFESTRLHKTAKGGASLLWLATPGMLRTISQE
jgi:phosphohistidine phosphatase